MIFFLFFPFFLNSEKVLCRVKHASACYKLARGKTLNKFREGNFGILKITLENITLEGMLPNK